MRRSPSKSYPNPNSHTGRSRYVPSVLVSPLHTQTHTRMESEDILRVSVIRSSQELFPNHQNIHRPPSKSNPNPNSHTGRSRYVPSVLVSPLHTPTHTRMEREDRPKALEIRPSQQ